MSVLSKERLDTKTLDNAIKAQKIGAETALEKVTVWFLEELKQYRDLEEQGLLLRLPVVVGQTLYTNQRKTGWYFRLKDAPYRVQVGYIGISNSTEMGGGFFIVSYENHGYMMQFNFSDIGKTVFLTQSEAEEKLRELEGR